jgi:hypothetical protein
MIVTLSDGYSYYTVSKCIINLSIGCAYYINDATVLYTIADRSLVYLNGTFKLPLTKMKKHPVHKFLYKIMKEVYGLNVTRKDCNGNYIIVDQQNLLKLKLVFPTMKIE